MVNAQLCLRTACFEKPKGLRPQVVLWAGMLGFLRRPPPYAGRVGCCVHLRLQVWRPLSPLQYSGVMRCVIETRTPKERFGRAVSHATWNWRPPFTRRGPLCLAPSQQAGLRRMQLSAKPRRHWFSALCGDSWEKVEICRSHTVNHVHGNPGSEPVGGSFKKINYRRAMWFIDVNQWWLAVWWKVMRWGMMWWLPMLWCLCLKCVAAAGSCVEVYCDALPVNE